MSPIHAADVTGLIVFLLEHEDDQGRPGAHGAFNAVCPNPVRNADFTRALAAALHRPAILPAPAFALRGLLGELSTVMLDSQRALPPTPCGSVTSSASPRWKPCSPTFANCRAAFRLPESAQFPLVAGGAPALQSP